MELQNSTVLVTGATGNMGPYVVDQLVNEGATIIGTYVSDTERTEAEERTDQSAAVSYSQVDLTGLPAVEAFDGVEATNEHERTLDEAFPDTNLRWTGCIPLLGMLSSAFTLVRRTDERRRECVDT